VSVRPATESDRPWLEQTLTDRWGTLAAARLDELIDLSPLPGLVAEYEGKRVGVLTYQIAGDAWEVVTIDVIVPSTGVGTALLNAVIDRARAAGARRVWLITTNDNTHGLRFYQRNGFDLVAMHRNAVDRARRLKPSIPVTGNDGIPIRHELELEVPL
jgi:N-acetylglutamate synthase-like GNAT family acetyltransferase